MKKLLPLLSLAVLLTGCTPLLSSPHGDVPESDTVILSTQFPVYDKDIDRIQVILENAGETNLEYGAEWAVETRQGDDWKQLPFAEGYGWIQPLYTLMPGGTDIAALEEFHNALFEEYLVAFGGSRNAMFRLKEHWGLLLSRFPVPENLSKRLRKTTDLGEFRAVTGEIFRYISAEIQ